MTFVTYAQNFEDVILWRALRDVEHGLYIDIGAHDPVVDSVSCAFYEKGWRGIHVEPTPSYAAKLREARPDEIVVEAAVTDAAGPIKFHEIPETGLSTGRSDIAKHHCRAGFENRPIVVPSIRLDKLIEMAGQDVHWLKIDVEGMEADVLRSWGDSQLRPWVVVVEATYPGTQQSTKDLWIDEILSRGYREVYFDGVSCYFLHAAHDDLAVRFVAPPNLFDEFQVTAAHFSAWTLKDSLKKELDQASHEAWQREARHAEELAEVQAGVQSEREAHGATMREMEASRASSAEALSASEREHRIAIDHAWRERQESETGLRSRWSDLENELRAQLASASNDLRERDVELATLRERTAQLQDRIEGLDQQGEASRQRIAQLETEIESVRKSANDLQSEVAAKVAEQERQSVQRERLITERDRQIATVQSEIVQLRSEQRQLLDAAAAEKEEISRRLAESEGVVGKANEIIRKALAEPLDGWQQLGRALALSRGDGTKQMLRSWDSSSQPTAGTVDAYMSFISPGEARNPYLRANSLSELLSWKDIDFVRCAYVTILGRQPDFQGEKYYTDRIRLGYSKMHVLWQLRTSSEGPRHDPGIAGLDRALRRARRARMPVVGAFFRLLIGEEGAGEAVRRHRVLVNRMDRLESLQKRLLQDQDKLQTLIERPAVIVSTIAATANGGGEVPQNGNHAHPEAFAEEAPSVRILSPEARKRFHSFTGAR